MGWTATRGQWFKKAKTVEGLADWVPDSMAKALHHIWTVYFLTF